MERKKVAIPIVATLLAVLLIQIFYPSARLLPGTFLAGQNFSFANKSDAVKQLDQLYNDADIEIFFGDNEMPYAVVQPIDIGLSVGNVKKISQMDYPWYIRIIPTSILWYGLVYSGSTDSLTFSEVALNQFISNEFGRDCSIEPINAAIKINGTALSLAKASDGGICQIDEVRESIKNLSFESPNYSSVRIGMDVISPDIDNDEAQRLASSVGTKLLGDLPLLLGDDYGTVDIPVEELASWLEFEVVDKKLVVAVNNEKSSKFFADNVAPVVSKAAGVSIITTTNLSNITHENGAEGKVINVKETSQRIADYLMDSRTSVDVAIQSISPELQYAKTFDTTSDGISAYMKYLVQMREGKYGIQLYEIGGLGRQAGYHPDRQFTVAGASRFIVGYGMLTNRQQSLPMGSNNDDSACFDSVMKRYATDCVDTSVMASLRQNQDALGLDNTAMLTSDIKSTANDLASFLIKIYRSQTSLTPENRSILLDSLRSSEPRNGIATLASGAISATGTFGRQYSDVTLVSSGDKAYVMSILTDGARMSDIVDVAKRINDFMHR